MARVLLVEDDHAIRKVVLRELATQGHAVSAVTSGMAAIEEIMGDPPDVIVLDLGLPDVDGADVLRMIRATSSVPVIVATARGDERSMVALLDAGADDYVTKPFSVPQLEARMRAVLRRTETDVDDVLRVGGLEIDRGAHRARLDDVELDLSRMEFALLTHLAEHAGAVVSKRELLAEVWQQPLGGSERTVDVHLSWLRRKLGETADAPRYLHTVRGVGIRLEAPAA